MVTNGVNSETVPLAFDVFENEDTVPDSTPIILIHGLFWNKFMFKELGESLNRETRRKVYSLDVRCHGQSPFCERCDSLIITEDIKRFIQEQNLEKVSFVCHSFSSTAAYLIALEKPESVEKIVMVDHAPFAEFSEKILRENVLPQFNGQNRFLITLDPKLSLMEAKRKILRLVPFATKGQEFFLKKVAYDLDKIGNKYTWKTNIQFLMDRYSEQAFAIKPRGSSNHPILIVRCNDSVRVTDEKFEAILRHNPNAKLKTLEGTTHLLHLEKMEEFLEIVRDFLNS